MPAVVSPERRNFSKIRSFMDLPNLIDVQRRSFDRFLIFGAEGTVYPSDEPVFDETRVLRPRP